MRSPHWLRYGLTRRPKYWSQFLHAKGNATYRNIAFLFTYQEWEKIWQDSGHWDERGRRAHEYCMARFLDEGAYVVGNVEIVTNSYNASNNYGRKVQTKEERQKHSLAAKKWYQENPNQCELRARLGREREHLRKRRPGGGYASGAYIVEE